MFSFQENIVILSAVNIIKMIDNTKMFNKTIAGVTIFAISISSIKEKDFEQHILEFFHQDQISMTPAASGAYGEKAIGGDWLINSFNTPHLF
jgi:hypothetical protein